MPDLTKSLFILGVTTSAFLSGGVSYISLLAIPSFLDAPNNTTLLTQWRHLLSVGTKTARTLTIFSVSCNFLNAWLHFSPPLGTSTAKVPVEFARTILQGGRVGRFVMAGLATLSIIPFTMVVMMPMNVELKRREEISFNALDSGDQRSAAKLADRGYLTPSGMTPRMDLDVGDDYFARDRRNKEETADLVRRWGRWNVGRAVGPLVGAWVAFSAL